MLYTPLLHKFIRIKIHLATRLHHITSPNGPYDGKLAENMRIPVFVLGHDNNVTGILQNKKHQAFIEDLPKPFNKVSTFLKANTSFFSYVAKNIWSLKE